MPLDNELEFNWDDEIQEDSQFTLLDPGDYKFTVKKFERGLSKQGNKKAVLTLEVTDGTKTTTIVDSISLLKTAEWKISEFFRSVGLKKHGEKLRMRWNEVNGLTGKCSVIIDNYNGKKRNRIDAYLDPVPEVEEVKW